MVWWVWLAGAVLMAALGPSPRWLAAEFMEEGGGDLREWKRWAMWGAQAALWPAALCWYARQAMYER
ncbi:hypothetical protein AB0M39_35150 [Streptomyces sp. NPDC051907]|uniref:hypothetical protein n=1 Tax=Streptomyces sp. NPDC051907 TaxID=3155284 RepID=UPI00343DEDAA